MLEKIKMVQGINHDEFDNIIEDYINSAKLDLIAIGIAEDKVNKEDPLIKTAIFVYVLSFLDVNNSAMYTDSYNLQKDILRHLSDYQEKEDEK